MGGGACGGACDGVCDGVCCGVCGGVCKGTCEDACEIEMVMNDDVARADVKVVDDGAVRATARAVLIEKEKSKR